ncbi:MAG: RsmD family RNA methyltransferase, partial [Aquificaceae bacterium]|nr:RsmD family RNA methyltransferase [Aquificaceae bacterium]
KKASGKQKLRPTSQLVKRAVFNMLGDVDGYTFLDLFAGTGQMGIFAEERGARVLFVEKNPKIATRIREKTKGEVVVMDALQFLERLDSRVDIIFADPPYDYEKYELLIDLCLKRLAEGGVFILEHSSKLDFGAPKRKVYGDTALSLWRKEA